jgi:hypothetical protein
LCIVSIGYIITKLPEGVPLAGQRSHWALDGALKPLLTNRRGIMAGFFSFVFSVLLPLAIGIAGIYLAIDFFEYLKKNHPSKYRQMSFESLFGISAASFPFHFIKPLEFIGFLFSSDNLQDNLVIDYKKKIKLLLFALLGLFALFILIGIVT